MRKAFTIFLNIIFIFNVESLFAENPSVCHKNATVLESDPNCFIEGCVNVITGDYSLAETEIVLKGPDDLIMQSYYSNSSIISGVGGGCWRLFPQCWLVVENDNDKKHEDSDKAIDWVYAYTGEKSGSILTYSGRKCRTTSQSKLLIRASVDHTGYCNTSRGDISGKTNILNNRLEYDSMRMQFVLFTGDGTKRYFEKVNQLPRKWIGIELFYEASNKFAYSEIYRLVLEILPSGNKTQYTYTPEGELLEVRMCNSKETKVFSWIKFAYLDQAIHITTSDDKTIQYQLNGSIITHKEYSFKAPQSYKYNESKKIIKRIVGNRALEIEYDRSFRVKSLKKNAESLSDAYCDKAFVYKNGSTEVCNAEGYKKKYNFDQEDRLCSIEHFGLLKNKYRVDRFFWSGNEDTYGCLLSKVKEDSFGNPITVKNYEYDAHRNNIKKTIYGNLSGKKGRYQYPSIDKDGQVRSNWDLEAHVITMEYSHDGFNLIEKITDCKRSEIIHEYALGSNRLVKKLIKENRRKSKNILLRTFYSYNDDGVLISIIEDDGSKFSQSRLSTFSERRITEFVPKENYPNVGLPVEIIRCVQDPKSRNIYQEQRVVNLYSPQGDLLKQETYDANNMKLHAKYWRYDSYGNVVSEKDKEGIITLYSYDDIGNCISKKVPDLEFKIDYIYNEQNKIIKESENYQGFEYSKTYTYDLIGRIKSSTDRLGNKTDFEYDSFGFLAKVVYPAQVDENGVISRPFELYENDIFGNQISITDAKGYKVLKAYNIRGNPIRIDYPDKTFELFKYDSEGTLHRQLTRDNFIHIYEYDFLGRSTAEIRSKLKFSEIRFDRTLKNLKKYNTFHTLYSGDSRDIFCYTYDIFGRITSKYRPSLKNGKDTKESRKEQYRYNSQGKVCQKKVFFDLGIDDYSIEYFDYDSSDRVISRWIEDSEGSVLEGQKFIYNKRGFLIEELELLEGEYKTVSCTQYDPLGRPVSIFNGEGSETKLVYKTQINEANQNILVKTVIDPNGIVTKLEFDVFDRPVQIEKISPEGILIQKTKHTYDIVGNRVAEENFIITPDGQVVDVQLVEFVYGPMNRLDKVHKAADSEFERVTSFYYNDEGVLDSLSSSDLQYPLIYSYDNYGNISKIEQKSEAGFYLIKNTYKYDLAGNIVKANTLNGITVEREYNLFNEMISETIRLEGYSYKTEYDYDKKGRVKKVFLPDESYIEYTYGALYPKKVSRFTSSARLIYEHEYVKFNERGQLKKENLIFNAGLNENYYDLSKNHIRSENEFYIESVPPGGYDLVGNLLKLDRNGCFNPSDLFYCYDFLYQVTTEKGEFQNEYSYDSIGNCNIKNSSQYSYNALNQLVEGDSNNIKYAPNGVVSQYVECGSSFAIQSNGLGQIIQIKIDNDKCIECLYDPFGRRICKKMYTISEGGSNFVSNDIYLYIGSKECGRIDKQKGIIEFAVPGISNNELSDQYISIELKNNVILPLYDLRGHIVALVDPLEKRLIESYQYSVFGERRMFDGNGIEIKESLVENFWSAFGERVDQNTGLICIGHRYFNPRMGRWMSSDPALFKDGPNLYAYCHNNPILLKDLNGLNSKSRRGDKFTDYFYSEVEGACVCRTHRTCLRGGDIGSIYGIESNRISYMDYFEAGHDNKSIIYELSSEKEFRPLSKGRIMFINGIDTKINEAVDHANYLALLSGGYNIHGVYNATHGKLIDAFEYLSNHSFCATPPVRLLHKKWNSYFRKSGLSTPLLQICHSQGAALVRNALMCYPKSLREKIIVVAIAPGAYIPRSICKEVTHYVTKWNRDIVPWLDVRGRISNKRDVVELEPQNDSPLFDHDFQSPTYQDALFLELDDYVRKHGA